MLFHDSIQFYHIHRLLSKKDCVLVGTSAVVDLDWWQR